MENKKYTFRSHSSEEAILWEVQKFTQDTLVPLSKI